jgi:hypothetical protein
MKRVIFWILIALAILGACLTWPTSRAPKPSDGPPPHASSVQLPATAEFVRR